MIKELSYYRQQSAKPQCSQLVSSEQGLAIRSLKNNYNQYYLRKLADGAASSLIKDMSD